MQQWNDIYLIKQVLGGNDRAFAELLDRYQTKVFNFVRYTLRDEEDAYEVTQDTFVKAYRALDTFRNEAKFSTWLLRIAYFNCMTLLRKKKPAMVDIADHNNHLHENNIQRDTELKDMKQVLASAMSQLTEDEQAMITMFYYNELSIKEICDITGETDSKVKTSLHRTRKKLLKTLNQLGIEEWVL